MQQETLNNYSGKARDCHEERNQLFCEEIREFINDSRKNQTVYANFEGHYERTVKSNDLTQLDTLVFLTLSDGKDRASLTPDEFHEADKLTKLMVNKILNSRMKFNCNEIRFQVVWIYYFDYSDKQMKSVPVFKLYKRGSGPEAVYIDMTVVEYDSWDHFIMFCQFPASFICVPRRGEYTFRGMDGGDLLDLEYICKNSQLRDKFQRAIRPVSQTLIQRMKPTLIRYVRKSEDFLQMVVKVAIFFNFQAHPTGRWVVLCISVLGIGLKIVERIWGGEESENALESTAKDYSLVLLNDTGEELSSWKKCLNVFSDAVQGPLEDKSLVNLIKLFKNPKENLMEILKYVPCVVEFCELLYLCCAGANGSSGPDIQNWILLFDFLSRFSRGAMGQNQIKETGLKESENWLCNLEKYSSEKVVSKLEPSPGLSRGKEIFKPSSDVLAPQEFRSNLFGFKVCLLVNSTEPEYRGFLQRLLKSKYTLQKGPFFVEINCNGKIIGVVIPFSIQSQNYAIVAVRLDELT